jgi:hypothetical protein
VNQEEKQRSKKNAQKAHKAALAIERKAQQCNAISAAEKLERQKLQKALGDLKVTATDTATDENEEKVVPIEKATMVAHGPLAATTVQGMFDGISDPEMTAALLQNQLWKGTHKYVSIHK